MGLVCIQNSSLLVYSKSQKVSASYCLPFRHSRGKNQPVGGFRPPPPPPGLFRVKTEMYSYKIGEKDEPKKCKGIKKCVVKKTISFEDYIRCLFEGRVIHRSQMMFRLRKHKVKTLEVNKLALSREDDKRISINGIDSLAMGHYKVWGYE